jgi:hypothetical protein
MATGGIPEELARLLNGRPPVDATEQAFPFLTVDEAGFPHVALLSRAELAVSPDGTAVLAAVASKRTRANLERDRKAGLIAISGTAAHYAKFQVGGTLELGGVLGCWLELVEHKVDDIGVVMDPITFQTSAELAASEYWALSNRILEALSEAASRGR